MTKKKKYFPNNWDAIKEAPDDAFRSPTGNLSFDKFMEWRVAGWELPSSVCCIIRKYDSKTNKVKEYVYSKPHAALNFIDKLLDEGHEFTICDEEQVAPFRSEP